MSPAGYDPPALSRPGDPSGPAGLPCTCKGFAGATPALRCRPRTLSAARCAVRWLRLGSRPKPAPERVPPPRMRLAAAGIVCSTSPMTWVRTAKKWQELGGCRLGRTPASILEVPGSISSAPRKCCGGPYIGLSPHPSPSAASVWASLTIKAGLVGWYFHLGYTACLCQGWALLRLAL